MHKALHVKPQTEHALLLEIRNRSLALAAMVTGRSTPPHIMHYHALALEALHASLRQAEQTRPRHHGLMYELESASIGCVVDVVYTLDADEGPAIVAVWLGGVDIGPIMTQDSVTLLERELDAAIAADQAAECQEPA